jgi:competence protein ComEC
VRDSNAPLFVPALAFALGAALAHTLLYLPLPHLVLLALLGLACGGRWGVRLTALCAGLLVAAARLGLPGDPVAVLDRWRPVEALVEVSGHWSRGDDGWLAEGAVVRLAQGRQVVLPRLEVLLELPDAESDPPPFGTRLRVRGYLARSPALGNRLPLPHGPWRLRAKSRLLIEVEEAPSWPWRAADRAHRRVDRALDAVAERLAPAERSGLAMARALVLGDTAQVPEGWKRALRLTGTYHLLSISGLHVAWVAGLVWLASTPLPRRFRWLLTLLSIGAYLALVGPLPALLRSALMAGLVGLALLLERPPAPLNALGAALLLLTFTGPELTLSPAFQLTFAATAALLGLAPRFASHWHSSFRLPPLLARPLAASLAAQLATWPLSLPRFYLLTPLAPLWNLLAIPWSGALLALSLATSFTALISPAAAAPVARLLSLLLRPLEALARLPPSTLYPVPLLVPFWLATLGSLLLTLLVLLPPRRLFQVGVAAALAGASFLLSATPLGRPAALPTQASSRFSGAPARPGREARPPALLALLDVGQGDAILVRDGVHAVLVDGGGWRRGGIGGHVLLPALLAEGVRRLDAVAMSHPDNDHCGGLVEIAAYLPVDEVWMGEGWPREGCAGRLMSLPGSRLRILRAGDRRAAGRWSLRVLQAPAEAYLPENERSLILAAALGRQRILLTGDAGRWAEQRLLDEHPGDLPSAVLKVGHHGSRTSTGELFLAAVGPRLALVSAGEDNLYHHPSPETLARLAAAGARVLRTDQVGEIVLQPDGAGRLHIELPAVPKAVRPAERPPS